MISLLKSGVGYEGMIYRNVAESISLGKLPDLSFSNLVFIGFNALNPCEQKLFKALQSAGKAIFYWDYDEYYLGMENHEAGHFIRQNLSAFNDAGKEFNLKNLADPEKKIQVHSIPSDAGQAQIVHSILEDARKTAELGEETAIVLADEELLIPVLNALPVGLSEINVTMGYPVSATPVFSLVEHLISLQRSLRDGKDTQFYYADVLPLIQHQYISLRERQDSADIVREIHAKNLIYLSASSLARNELFKVIFRRIGEPEEIAGYLLTVLEIITGGGGDDEKPVPALELEFIYRIYTRIKRLKDILSRLELKFGLPIFLRLFHKFLQRTRIPFTGEPLAGIQVMGVLETRVLDFERVILLSMNEGSFPRTGTSNSFIPHNLRLGFQLPTIEYQDAVYAYYFYRLIHRPKSIHLLYNNKAEGLTTGEKSRYIYQLKYDKNFNISEMSVGFDVQSSPAGPLWADKSPAVMEKLYEYCTSKGGSRYLSPSALNSFIDCPLQFYFGYIAGIREPDEIQEEIDPALFGTLLHESVRKIYAELKNPVEAAHLDEILKNPDQIRKAIDESFQEILFRNSEKGPEGRNRVIREIIYTYVEKVIEQDKAYSPLKIHSLEEAYSMEFLLGKEEAELTIKVGGKIDRIDLIGKAYRVIDYKTGIGKMFFGSIEEIFDPEEKNRNRAVFQTFLYAKLFISSGNYKGLAVIPGLYLIRDIFKDDFRYNFSIGTSRKSTAVTDYFDLDEEFTMHLRVLLNRLFDPKLRFVQTEQEETCRNCLYKGICRR